MIYHILFPIFVIGIALLLEFLKKNNKTKLYVALFIILFAIFVLFFSSQSNNVGLDTENYAKSYIEISDVSFSAIIHGEKTKLLYNIICKMFSLIKVPFPLFQAILYMVIFGGLFIFIYKFGKCLPLFFTFIFCMPLYQMLYSGLRQCLATSMFLVGFCLLFNNKLSNVKKLFWFYIFTFVAILFHVSALLCLLVPLVLLIKRYTFAYYLSLILIVITLVFGPQIYQFMIALFSFELPSSENRSVPIFAFLLLILIIIVYLIYLFFGDGEDKVDIKKCGNIIKNIDVFQKNNNENNINLYLLFGFIIVLFMATATANAEAPRFHYYFDIFVAALVATIPGLLGKKFKTIYIGGALVIGLIIYAYRFLPYIRYFY